MWVIGGVTQDGMIKNDVWYSDDGAHWIPANMSAAFPPRAGSCSVVFNDKMWIIGGKVQEGGYKPENSMYKNDIWYSAEGNIWTQVTQHATFSGRTGHQCVVFQDKMWVIGGTAMQDFTTSNITYFNHMQISSGIIRQVSFSDVWYSRDGINWTAATLNAAFGERYDHRAVVFHDRMWVINGKGYRDIWFSQDGGEWIKIDNTPPPFNWGNGTLEKFGLVVFEGKMFVIAGEGGWFTENDMWYTTNGKTWFALNSGKALDSRWEQSVVAFNNRMWLVGGRKGVSKTYKNDVWYTPRDMNFEPIKHP
jgi:hypothetical protein